MSKLSAKTIFYSRGAVADFNSGIIFTCLWALYIMTMKLSLVDISLISIVITLSNLILEIPTGVLADHYSRRLSVVVGGIFIGAAFALLGFFPLFWVALLAAFIEAVGDTCVSGALEAWIADEVGEDQVGAVFLRGSQISVPAGWAGIVFGVGLAALWNYQVALIAGGILWMLLTIFLILFMPETGFQRDPSLSTFSASAMLVSFKASFGKFTGGVRLVRASSTLRTLFFAFFLISAFSDAFYKFSRAAILKDFVLPVITLPGLGVLKDNFWIGVLAIPEGLISLVGAEVVRRKVRLDRPATSARLLFGIYAVMALALLAFGVTGHLVLALAAWVVLMGVQDIGRPILDTWLNLSIPSPVRATVLSMSSQAGMVGTLGSSTGLGAFGDRFGVRAALGLSGAILLPVLLIFGRSAKTAPEPILENESEPV